jgi:hypothetical protein
VITQASSPKSKIKMQQQRKFKEINKIISSSNSFNFNNNKDDWEKCGYFF